MTAISYAEVQALARRGAQTRTLWRAMYRLVGYVLLIAAGLALAFTFDAGHYLPVGVSVVALFAISTLAILFCRFAPLSPLTRLMIVLYTSPFTVCLGYLSSDTFLWWYTPGSIAYMSDPVVDEIMLMIGLIGGFGLVVGYILAAGRRAKPEKAARPARTLKAVPFLLTLLVAFFFSYINTPSETIFSALYDAASGIAGKINFNAAYLVAYTLLMLLIIDAEQERNRPRVRMWKRLITLAVTLYIVVFFQLARGDRDSFGYLVGLAAIFLTEPMPARIRGEVIRRRFAVLFVLGTLVIATFFAVGEMRYAFAVHEDLPFGTAVVKGMKEGFTGSAVLLTNLSQAHAYRLGEMTVERGQTYLDYLRSLPPGFVTYALGIERPIENNRGPNFWFTDISAGGVHVVTVPFRNFLAPGAFLVMMLCGYLIARWEIIGQRSTWLARFWYGSLFVVSAQWFWYGDISFVREVMIFALAAAIYAVVSRIGAFSVTAER